MHHQPPPHDLNPPLDSHLHKASTPSPLPALAPPIIALRQPHILEIEPYHIRLRRMLQLPTPLRPHPRHLPRALMARLQFPAQKRFFDGYSRGRGDQRRLPQSTAQGLPLVARGVDEALRSDDDGANWGPESLGEAERDAVEAGAVFPQPIHERLFVFCGCFGGNGFPQPGAVEVHLYRRLLGARPGRDGASVGEGEDCAREGVLETDQARWTGVDVGACDGVFSDVGKREVVLIRGMDWDCEGAGEGG